jgi:hypothetical protein
VDLPPEFATAVLGRKQDPWIREYVFIDVTRIGSRFYLLVVPAINQLGEVHVYLVEMFGPERRKLMCEFRTRYIIVNR